MQQYNLVLGTSSLSSHLYGNLAASHLNEDGTKIKESRVFIRQSSTLFRKMDILEKWLCDILTYIFISDIIHINQEISVFTPESRALFFFIKLFDMRIKLIWKSEKKKKFWYLVSFISFHTNITFVIIFWCALHKNKITLTLHD